MLGGDGDYRRLPYFFSDQVGLDMEFSGHLPPGAATTPIVRGDLNSGTFVAFWLAGGAVCAAMNMNIWGITGALQDLVRNSRRVDPAALADPAVPLA